MVNGIANFFNLLSVFINGIFNLTVPGTGFTFLGFAVIGIILIFIRQIIKNATE